MDQLVAETMTTLRNAAESGMLTEDVDEAIGVAADLLVKAQSLSYESGFPEIDAAEVTAAEGRELERLLQALLRKYPESGLTGSLLWALGKSDNPAYVEDFATHLERGVRMLLEGNSLVFNALGYLDKVEGGVFERDASGWGSESLTEVEKHLQQARAYLTRRGIRVPW